MTVGEEGRDDAEHRIPRDEEIDDEGERSFTLPAGTREEHISLTDQ